MADYRTVKTSMWAQDEWFMDLPIDGKLLWMYLFTNGHTSVCGLYKLPLRTIMFETGLSKERALELLGSFAACGKAKYADGVVWVTKMREHQGTASPQVAKRIQADLDAIPDTPLKREYLSRYGINTVSVGYLEFRADTETDTVTETDTETETKTEKESESSVNGSGGGNGHGTVDPSLFLTVIGFKDPEPFLKTVDETCLAMWAYHYATLTEPERKSVKSWPALINSKVRAGEQPRWKNGELKTAFYRAWTQ